jgi:hypothetical protein
VAFVILAAVPFIAGAPWTEWLGVFAVWFSFHHATVADRLSEAERFRELERPNKLDIAPPGWLDHLDHRVHCWRKERHYFILKEVFWLAYFVALEAWSALVGVILFLGYRGWRSYYRTRIKPLTRGDVS